jgi:hypothetical protein
MSHVVLFMTVRRTDLQVEIPLSISIADDTRTDWIASQGAQPQRRIKWLRSQNLPIFL